MLRPVPAERREGGPNRAIEPRTVLLVSADIRLRHRLAEYMKTLRWNVEEASGGAQAMMLLDDMAFESIVLDSWLPDLQVGELGDLVRESHPGTDLVFMDDRMAEAGDGPRATSPRHNELLHAVREARRNDQGLRERSPDVLDVQPKKAAEGTSSPGVVRSGGAFRLLDDGTITDGSRRAAAAMTATPTDSEHAEPLPDVVGNSRAMREIAWLVRMVASRSTTVLIEGETGTGKEVIARALHKLSPRAAKPFAVLNCAAIPESLLEAELFGHTRGAFTGAVQSRIGRIEAAHGGTLLLDEIGEMPVGMQAKMLRFLESGELQRVGDNESTRVDVRLIAATHQPLEKNAAEGVFRLDLYHRLAVFPIEVPPLRERMDDIPALAEHFLQQLAQVGPRKRLREDALQRLEQHLWPGNVRELMHVLERAVILSGASAGIGAPEIRYRRGKRA
jgi:DNA-binding NtrC family response regulator